MCESRRFLTPPALFMHRVKCFNTVMNGVDGTSQLGKPRPALKFRLGALIRHKACFDQAKCEPSRPIGKIDQGESNE